MTHLYLIPDWFFGLNIGMESLNAVITLAIAIASLYIYKTTKDDTIKRFGLGFLMIAISFGIWATLNITLITDLDDGTKGIIMESLSNLQILGVYAYILFFIVGLVTLVYTTLKINKEGVYYLLIGLSLLVIAVSLQKNITMDIIAIFLLSFITYHYMSEWRENRNKNTLKIFIAFAILTISNLNLIIAGSSVYTYVISHTLEASSYLIMLQTLICTLKHHGEKKKST